MDAQHIDIIPPTPPAGVVQEQAVNYMLIAAADLKLIPTPPPAKLVEPIATHDELDHEMLIDQLADDYDLDEQLVIYPREGADFND